MAANTLGGYPSNTFTDNFGKTYTFEQVAANPALMNNMGPQNKTKFDFMAKNQLGTQPVVDNTVNTQSAVNTIPQVNNELGVTPMTMNNIQQYGGYTPEEWSTFTPEQQASIRGDHTSTDTNWKDVGTMGNLALGAAGLGANIYYANKNLGLQEDQQKWDRNRVAIQDAKKATMQSNLV